jgi:hypothetical protein
MEEILNGVISEEISEPCAEDAMAERETSETEVYYEEENSNCSQEILDEGTEDDGGESLDGGEGEDTLIGAQNEEVSGEEDTHLYQGDEDISGDEAVRILKRELDDLRRQLNERDRAFERMTRECAEFMGLYPDTSLRSLPDTVWESVKEGVPIAAAYALYEKKRDAEARRAAEHNERVSSAAAPSSGGGTDDFYFSPAEVRRMSQGEVKQNYTKILESMRRWN